MSLIALELLLALWEMPATSFPSPVRQGTSGTGQSCWLQPLCMQRAAFGCKWLGFGPRSLTGTLC